MDDTNIPVMLFTADTVDGSYILPIRSLDPDEASLQAFAGAARHFSEAGMEPLGSRLLAEASQRDIEIEPWMQLLSDLAEPVPLVDIIEIRFDEYLLTLPCEIDDEDLLRRVDVFVQKALHAYDDCKQAAEDEYDACNLTWAIVGFGSLAATATCFLAPPPGVGGLIVGSLCTSALGGVGTGVWQGSQCYGEYMDNLQQCSDCLESNLNSMILDLCELGEAPPQTLYEQCPTKF